MYLLYGMLALKLVEIMNPHHLIFGSLCHSDAAFDFFRLWSLIKNFFLFLIFIYLYCW